MTADRAGATRSSGITKEEDCDANQWSLCPGRDHRAVVGWRWGREMETYVEEKTGKVLDRGGLTASVNAVEAAEHHA